MRWLLILVACGNSPHTLQQHEVTGAGELLNGDGTLREAGWSRHMLQTWDPSRVHDPSLLRQWDFFSVQSDTAAVNFTLTDLGFVQLASVGVIDFANSTSHSSEQFKGSGGDVLTLSADLAGSSSLTASGAVVMSFVTNGDATQIDFTIPASLLGDGAQGSVVIHRPALEYLSLATPFSGDGHQFFYEQKLEGLTADGTVTIGSASWSFTAAPAVEDWGRGQWPHQVTWRWAGASGSAGGQPIALNLGEGFGDDTRGTENLIVVNGVAHKLGEVSWSHGDDPSADWSFSGAGVSLVLHPAGKETGGLDFGAKYSHLKKGYGTLGGTVEVDGLSLSLDAVSGFAEEEQLAW